MTVLHLLCSLCILYLARSLHFFLKSSLSSARVALTVYKITGKRMVFQMALGLSMEAIMTYFKGWGILLVPVTFRTPVSCHIFRRVKKVRVCVCQEPVSPLAWWHW